MSIVIRNTIERLPMKPRRDEGENASVQGELSYELRENEGNKLQLARSNPDQNTPRPCAPLLNLKS